VYSGGTTNYTLTTSVNPAGAGTVSPAGGTYASGTTVTLTPAANSGYQFSNWSGDMSGSANPGTIVMTGNKSVTANFTAVSGLQAGDMSYYDGSTWTRIPKGNPGQVLTENAAQVPTWTTQGTWVNFSSSCVLEGWSSTNEKIVRYMVIGKTVYLSWFIHGSSNSSTCSITLPFRFSSSMWYTTGPTQIYDNGIGSSVGQYAINGSVDFGKLLLYTSTGNNWSTTGQKGIYGSMFYEMQ
jgi:hypothetical protein